MGGGASSLSKTKFGALVASFFLVLAGLATSFVPQQAFASDGIYNATNTITFAPVGLSSSSSVLAETGDMLSISVCSFIILALTLVAVVLVSKKKALASSFGSHAVQGIENNSGRKKVGMVIIACSLIAGSAFSFSKAFADSPKYGECTYSSVVYYTTDYKVDSIVVNGVNNSSVDFNLKDGSVDFADGLFDFEEDFTLSGITEENSVVKANSNWSQILTATGISLAEETIEGINERGSEYERMRPVYSYYEAWAVRYVGNYDGWKDYGDAYEYALDGTCATRVPEPQYVRERVGYEFVEWNTAADGTGETVDAVYLASHPITSDVTFYAVWKEVTSGDNTDTPGADSDTENPDQSSTPGDGTDMTDSDPDSGATEGDGNKDATSETDQNKDQTGDVDGKAEETSEN